MNRIQKRQTGTWPSGFHPVNPVILSLSAIRYLDEAGKKQMMAAHSAQRGPPQPKAMNHGFHGFHG
jgi:hypothetical protein